ncbi:MAG: nucleotidyltransferase family protein [Pseudomonadales bacterium]
MTNQSASPLPVSAIMLAAGRSQRFGSDKRLFPVASGSMLQQSLSKPLLLNIPTLLLLHPDDHTHLGDLLGDAVDHPQLNIGYADDAEKGMGHSLACAVSSLKDIKAVLIMLADMPWLQVETIDRLLQHYVEGNIVLPRYQGQSGHPVLFSKHWFPALQQLSGDHGAKKIIAANPQAINTVDVNDIGVIKDMDTPPVS